MKNVERLKNFYQKLKKFILDVLFPIKCLGCQKEGEWICQDCFANIKLIKHPVCPICEKPFFLGKTCPGCQKRTKLDGLLVAASYKDKILKQAIHIYKYRFIKDLSEPLSRILIKYLQELPFNLSQLVIVPVPLHRRRLRWRGFNQAQLLSQEVASYFNCPLSDDVLIRQRHSKPQMKIKDKDLRRENIKRAFICPEPGEIKDKRILLVDDVCTTASTLKECARTLKRAGAKEIWGLVLARG